MTDNGLLQSSKPCAIKSVLSYGDLSRVTKEGNNQMWFPFPFFLDALGLCNLSKAMPIAGATHRGRVRNRTPDFWLYSQMPKPLSN